MFNFDYNHNRYLAKLRKTKSKPGLDLKYKPDAILPLKGGSKKELFPVSFKVLDIAENIKSDKKVSIGMIVVFESCGCYVNYEFEVYKQGVEEEIKLTALKHKAGVIRYGQKAMVYAKPKKKRTFISKKEADNIIKQGYGIKLDANYVPHKHVSMREKVYGDLYNKF